MAIQKVSNGIIGISNSHVGIGASSPQARFQIQSIVSEGTGAIYTNGTQVVGSLTAFDTELRVGDEIIAINQVRVIVSIEGDANLTLDSAFNSNLLGQPYQYSRPVFVVNGTGNVGIGTRNPVSKLDILGDINVLAGGSIRLSDANSSNYVALKAPVALEDNVTWTLPASDGSADQILTTNGAGSLLWSSMAGDNLGNHTALQNFVLGNNWLSNDGGNTGIFIDANGNVGIGTNSPDEKLVIGVPLGNNSGTRLTIGDTGDNSAINIGESPNDFVSFGWKNTTDLFWLSTVEGGDLYAGTIVAKAGNVGIGTYTPENRLEIGALGITTSTVTQRSSGKIAIAGSFWNGTAAVKHQYSLQNIASTTTNEASRLGVRWDTSELLSITHTGNVGVGTTEPEQIFHIFRNGINTNNPGIFIEGGNPDKRWQIGLDNDRDFVIRDETLGQGRLIVKGTNGNVGVGTTAPNARLSFGTFAGETLRAYDTGIANTSYGLGISANEMQLYSADDGNIGFRSGGYNGNVNLYIMNNGNVGIGTTEPTQRMHVVNSTNDQFSGIEVQAYNLSQQATYGFEGVQASRNFIINSGGSINNSIYIDAFGKVGLGTTTPNGRLDIAGGNIILNGGWLSGDGGSEGVYVDSFGRAGIGTSNPNSELHVAGTGAIGHPAGTTEQRPGTPVTGMIRFNTSKLCFEGFNGLNWISLELNNGWVEMARVQSGSYDMGWSGIAEPVHSVTLGSFRIAKYEVTYELWYNVKTWAESNGYAFANAGREGRNGTNGAAPTSENQQPVMLVSWRDTIAWCNAISEMTGLVPCYYNAGQAHTTENVYRNSSTGGDIGNGDVEWHVDGYRLPTEAEWEYAARYINGTSITQGDWVSGATGSGQEETHSWYYWTASSTNPVGEKAPNVLDVYDMSGNAWEWVWDWYDSGYYASSPGTDPKGSGTGTLRLLRGGSWNLTSSYIRTSYRGVDGPSGIGDVAGYGFRIVRTGM